MGGWPRGASSKRECDLHVWRRLSRPGCRNHPGQDTAWREADQRDAGGQREERGPQMVPRPVGTPQGCGCHTGERLGGRRGTGHLPRPCSQVPKPALCGSGSAWSHGRRADGPWGFGRACLPHSHTGWEPRSPEGMQSLAAEPRLRHSARPSPSPCPVPLAPCPLPPALATEVRPSHLKSGPPSPSSAQGRGRTPQTGRAQQAITVPRARPLPPLRLSAVPKASIVLRARPSQGPVRTERSSPRRPRVPVSPALLDSTAQPRAQVGSGSTRPPWAPGPRALRQARDKRVGAH